MCGKDASVEFPICETCLGTGRRVGRGHLWLKVGAALKRRRERAGKTVEQRTEQIAQFTGISVNSPAMLVSIEKGNTPPMVCYSDRYIRRVIREDHL